MTTTTTIRPLAPAVYVGLMQLLTDMPAIELYNLTEAVTGRPVGSTVSRQTLENAGYYLPPLSVREARRANWYRRNHAA